MKRWLIGLLLIALTPAVGRAHFLWLLTEARPDGRQVAVYFGEAAEPDDPALLGKVEKAQAWAIAADGQATELALTLGEQGLESSVKTESLPAVIVLKHHYGVLTKGDAPFLLNYYAKTYVSSDPADWQTLGDADRLPLEITPKKTPDGVTLSVQWKGKPASGAVVTVLGPGLPEKCEGETNAQGEFACPLPGEGVYSIRAKFVEEAPGKFGDSEYQSVRHYSTLTLNNAASVSPAAAAPLAVSKEKLPDLPQGVTSFGAAVVGETLAIFGGNYGSAHDYANEEQSGDLWTLDLTKPAQWRQQAVGPKLQGLAAVAHNGKLYRVGGFTAMNKRGEENNLRSQAEFARWNAEAERWDALAPLPEARSSHDAAVVGDTLYVVGGWNMQGSSKEAHWHETALACDLSSVEPTWREIAAPPFQRRALALAAWNGKLYCLGGMNAKGGPTTAVAVYDPKSDAWSEGPALVGEPMDGFGAAAFACQGDLYVTSLSGAIQRLAGDGAAWERVGEVQQPRFFHRLLPWGDSKLVVVGGGNMTEGKTQTVEVLARE